MRLVFFGTADFAVPALEAVSDAVLLVVTQPDRASGRGLASRPSPVKEAAQRLRLPVVTPERCREPGFIETVEALEPDALLVAAYGQILPERLLTSAVRGAVNLHGSLLPKYRGAAPVQRCLENGDCVTGVTLMQMDKGMDTGDVIAMEGLEIGPDETAGELFGRLARLAGNMAGDWMPRVCAGDYPRKPQDHSEATYAPKIEKGDAWLDFDEDAKTAYDRFRAFTPFPGAYLTTRTGHVRVSRARLRRETSPGPGVVAHVKPEFVAGFRDGSLALLEVQPEGKKRMSGPDYANGAHLRPGDCLSP